ncbi:hypothetical protein QIG62_27485, partial [Klebsiella pneumoniae]|nr:hypothetical protein [Klebsiella pneumoniae]
DRGNGVLPILQWRFSKSAQGADINIQGNSIMASHKLLLLPGDGIGTEVMAEVKRIIDWLNKHGSCSFETESGLVGG